MNFSTAQTVWTMLFGLRPRRADEELSRTYDQNAVTPAVRGTSYHPSNFVYFGIFNCFGGSFFGVYVCSRPLRYTAYIVVGVIIYL